MSKALSRVNGKPDQSIANEDLSAAGPGGDFEITIDVESAIVNERPAVRGKFGALYEVCKKIDETIISVLGGIRKEQHGSSKSGSLLVLLHCFTDERFLDVFERIESGAIKDDLEQKLLNIGVETNGLVVSIRNMKEVQGIKTNIDKRVKNEKVVNQERDIAGGSKSAETEHAFIKPQIIVQGGAYFQKPDHVSDKLYMSLIKISRKKGYDILMNGGTAVDAVEEAVKVLEDSEYFNAGFGSLLNCDGEVECDAMIMDGNTLSSGAVISGRHFRNPVSLAKLIMNDTHHCALSGEGALKFAVEKGFLICDQNDLIAEHVKESKIPYSKFPSYVCKRFKSSDTVSAVARDKYGHFACAMSTGIRPFI